MALSKVAGPFGSWTFYEFMKLSKKLAENPDPESGTFWHILIKSNTTKIAEN
jgi:hypothetical protein